MGFKKRLTKRNIIRKVVFKALVRIEEEDRRLAPGVWGHAGGDATPWPHVCLIGAIGVAHQENLRGRAELHPGNVAPLIRNGAAGVIDDVILSGLSNGFEGTDSADIAYGWSEALEDLDDFYARFNRYRRNGLYGFAYELGAEIRLRWDRDEELVTREELEEFGLHAD